MIIYKVRFMPYKLRSRLLRCEVELIINWNFGKKGLTYNYQKKKKNENQIILILDKKTYLKTLKI